MPIPPDSASAPESASAADLATSIRPQRFGRTSPNDINDPIVEPLWAGVRVIGAAEGEIGALFEDGDPLVPDGISIALARMLAETADSAIVDGYLTKQAHPQDQPQKASLDASPSSGELLTQTFLGLRRHKHAEEELRREVEARARLFAPDDRVTLLVTDLLYLDGTWLLDIPLLERRRLLESVLPGDELVRPGPYVRPPIGSWLGSWRSQGFTGITFKEANSRYRPGETAVDWATAPMPRR
jgi:ATP dependent DNA ligase domain